MRLVKVILMLFFVALAPFAQAQVDSAYRAMLDELLDHSVKEVQVCEISSDFKNIVWLDAREPEEHQVSTIPGSILVGYDDFNFNDLTHLPRNAEIVVFCSVGYRSEKVAQELAESGFSDVSNLYGGIFQWVNEGREVETPEGVGTKQVHAFDRLWGKWLKKGLKVFR